MSGSRRGRRFASVGIVAGLLVAGTACDPQPHPSDRIELTHLVFADGSAMTGSEAMNERGDVVTCPGGECYVWRNGDISTIAREGATVGARDISNRGHVLGTFREGGETVPYVWRGGEMTVLPTGDATGVSLSSVNDHGVVAGRLSYGPVGVPWPFEAVVWRGGQLVTVPENDWAFSFATGINDGNEVAVNLMGPFDPEGPPNRVAAIWDLKSNQITELGDLGGGWSGADDINGRGMVIGTSETAEGESHAFLWRDGEMIDLGTLGGDWSRPNDLNEWGQVVGVSVNADGQKRGFLWDDGEMIDLGVDVRTGTGPNAINNWGQIVGYLGVSLFDSEGTKYDTEAFLWQNGRMADLGDLLPSDFPSDYYWSTEALDINDRGQILGKSFKPLGASGIRPAVMWEVSPTWGYHPEGLP